MHTYRTIQEVEEVSLCQHPDEIESYLTVLFDEYAHDGDTAALWSSLRSVNRVVDVSRLAAGRVRGPVRAVTSGRHCR